MSIQQQAQLADFGKSDHSDIDAAVLLDWYSRLGSFWCQMGHTFTAAELQERDALLLQEIGNDLLRISNSPVMAEHLAICVGHMNTEDGQLALCKLIKRNHPEGSIGTRLTPMIEWRERAKNESSLAKAFRIAPLQKNNVQRAENDSDFAPLDPAP